MANIGDSGNNLKLIGLLKKSFELFDGEGMNVVDARDVATIVYSLKLNPSLTKINQWISDMTDIKSEGGDNTNNNNANNNISSNNTMIKYSKFEEVMLRVMTKKNNNENTRNISNLNSSISDMEGEDSFGQEVEEEEEEIEDNLILAFQTILDPEKKGFVSVDDLINILTNEGERFSQEEIEEFLSFVSVSAEGRGDDDKHVIYYEDYATYLSTH